MRIYACFHAPLWRVWLHLSHNLLVGTGGCSLVPPRAISSSSWTCLSPSASSHRATSPGSDHPGGPVLNCLLFINVLPVLWGPNWLWYYRHGLELLSVLLLAQPRMPQAIPASRDHCWLMLSSLPSRTPRASSAELLPSQTGPSQYCCQQLFLSRSMTWHLSLLNFIWFLFPHSSSLSRAVWVAALPSRVSPASPRLLSSASLTRVGSSAHCPLHC